MKTINLKKYYYPLYETDTFIELPDEIADAIVEEWRAENANDAKQHYHCYSLDASPGIEHHFPEQVISPEDILMEKETEREQEAAHALMMERLREALATLTPRQASCLHARFWEGKQFKEIAEAEGFTTSAAIVTVRNAIIKLNRLIKEIVVHEHIDSDKTRHISIEIHFNLKPIPEVEQVKG